MAAARRTLTALEAALRKTASILDRAGARWALVGGLAVSVRAEPRFTRDVDLAVAVTGDSEAETLVHHLLAAGFGLVATVEQRRTARLATARLRAPGQASAGVVVDLLFASSGIEPEIVAAAERLRVFPRTMLPVASVGHLIAMKLLARARARPQDSVDLRALLDVASSADLRAARHAVDTITERGTHRGRKLVPALERLLRRK